MSKKNFIIFSVGLACLRFLIASSIPLGNDEAIYWDLGRFLQLSYVEHPVGVALVARLSQFLFGFLTPELGARGLVILLHLMSCMILIKIARDDVKRILLFSVLQIIPAFSLGGMMLLPDAGLLFVLALLMLHHQAERFKSVRGIALGAFLIGCAFLFKYHALIVFLTYLCFLIKRKKYVATLLSLFIFFTVTLPVWIWNYQNHYASFIFQGGRTAGEWNLPVFMRVFAAQILLLSPLFFWFYFRNLFIRKNYSDFLFASGATVIFTFGFLALKTQTLPHWFIPGWWLMLLPIINETKTIPIRLWRNNIILCVTLMVLLTTALGIPAVKNALIKDLFQSKPGFLGEMTFWPEIVKNSEVKFALDQLKASQCQNSNIYSYRWYEVAHLAFSLPGQPIVHSLSTGLESSYSLRDEKLKVEPLCPFVVLTHKTFLKDLPKNIVEHSKVTTIVLASHSDRPFALLSGVLPSPKIPEIKIGFHQRTFEEMFHKQKIEIQKKYPKDCAGCLAEMNAIEFANHETLKIGRSQKFANFYGILHSHTGFSDGKETPREAFTMARDLGRMDFMAVTEHPEYWIFSDLGKWSEIEKIAQEESRDNFIALRGFEWSHILSGHYVVLNSATYCGADRCPTLPEFSQWLEKSENKNAMAWFAHPGFLKNATRLLEFNSFNSLSKILSERFIGIEVIHWDGYRPFLKGFTGSKPYFDEAIAKGWKLSPMGSQDNHSANWGMSGSNRTVVLAENLSRLSILDALKNRRFFATKNESLHFNFEVKHLDRWLPMGSTLKINNDTVDFVVSFADPDDEVEVSRLEVIFNGSVIKNFVFHEDFKVLRKLSGEIEFQLKSSDLVEKNSVYVRLYQGHDEFLFTQSGPIFIER